MYSVLSLVLACSSLAVAKPIADVSAFKGVAERDVDLLPRYGPHTRGVMIRRDANKTFDLGFEATDVTLFSGSWPVATGTTVSLDLECVECRTYGELNAFMEFPDNIEELLDDLKDFNPFNDASLTVGFQGVGALIDLSVTTRGTGHFTIPLYKSETPLGISGPGFQAGISFGVDLIVGITAEIETEGGFEVTIPDGSSFTINLDEKVGNSAKFTGASATLLPLSVDAPATITVALRVAVQGGIELPKIPLIDAKAIAGAYINIPEVILGEQFSMPPANGSDCILPVTAEININAGAYVDIGVDIADITLGDYNPTVSTTFFDAATSTCLVTLGQETSTPLITGTGAVATSTAACPSPLVTSTATTTSTYTVTSCAASVVNCPNSLAQVIVVTDPITRTTTLCPVATSAALADAPFANATTSGVAYLTLSSMSAPVTNSLSVASSVATPSASLITGSPYVAASSASVSASASASVAEGAKEAVTTSSVSISARTPCAKKAITSSASSSSSA